MLLAPHSFCCRGNRWNPRRLMGQGVLPGVSHSGECAVPAAPSVLSPVSALLRSAKRLGILAEVLERPVHNPALTEALEDDSPQVRRLAMFALRQHVGAGDKAVVSAVVKAMKETTDDHVR